MHQTKAGSSFTVSQIQCDCAYSLFKKKAIIFLKDIIKNLQGLGIKTAISGMIITGF
jgi:hypothetical protein